MPFDIAGARYLGQIASKRWTTDLLPQGPTWACPDCR